MARRALGLDAATALVVGEVIGVGIFLTPAEMAKDLGSPFWILVVWLTVGACVVCGALSYGELAARFPEAGGGYVYLRQAWGPGVAFLYGWKSLLVMDPGITAALGAGLGQYAAVLFPLDEIGRKAVAIGAIAVLGLISALGIRIAGSLVRWLAAAKLVLLAAIIGLGFASSHGSWANFHPFVEPRAGSAPLIAGLAGGVIGAFFSFGGFWDVAKVAGEVRDPTRTLPRAIVLGVGIATVVYVLTSGAFVYLVPIEQVGSGQAFAAQAGAALFGDEGARVFASVVLVAIAGSLAAVLMTAPRVYFAMAQDGLFLRSVGRLHPRFGTPSRAVAIQTALSAVMVAIAPFEAIVAYFVFASVLFVALTVAGLYRLPRLPAPPFRVPGYPLTPSAFLLLLVLLSVLFAAGRPREAALGTAVIALGWPIYRFVVAPRRARLMEEPHGMDRDDSVQRGG